MAEQKQSPRDKSLDQKKDVLIFSRENVYFGMRIIEEWDPVASELKVPELRQTAVFGGTYCEFPTDPEEIQEFAEFLIKSYVPVLREVELTKRSIRSKTVADVEEALSLTKDFRK